MLRSNGVHGTCAEGHGRRHVTGGSLCDKCAPLKESDDDS